MKGFMFTASPNSTGETITLVATKNDHESSQTIPMTLLPAEVENLRTLLLDANMIAKERRKAIRKVAATAKGEP